ncbi:MAG: glutamate formimidoyltransferase [Candidatus Thermoplasmatota archaeon]|nr:glutamate formimidoyltransferase [Candidatus Thermoplasmatota archaeon]
MVQVVECIPNFSEGRRAAVVQAISEAIAGVEGVRLLGEEMDPDHNRAVLTFVGEPNPVVEAAFRAVAKAVELIDLTKHRGEHPRIGAADVVPFVPIANITMEECVNLARELGRRVWEELRVPVYFYAEAALRDDRRLLPTIRKGEFEGLREALGKDPDRDPDVGDPNIHPTAGATIVGARGPLIAYNVNLATDDLALAQAIAKRVRASSGGFPEIQAKGFSLEDRGQVQVSMNVMNFRVTSVSTVFEAIRKEAEDAGVAIAGSEIVGLVPLEALLDAAEALLRLEGFQRDQILERRLWE